MNDSSPLLMPPGDPEKENGVWERGSGTHGRLTALISCPRCGGIFSLTLHKIDNNGDVRPSVTCPLSGCSFHERVRLKGWSPPE